jgi:autotransporter-associated beta strand protein
MRIFAPSLIVFLLLASGVSRAATVTWTGGGVNNNWGTDANWSTGTDPAVGDFIVFSDQSARLTNNMEGAGYLFKTRTLTFSPDMTGNVLIGGGVYTNDQHVFNRSIQKLVQFTNTTTVFSGGSSASGTQVAAVDGSLFLFSPNIIVSVPGNINHRADTSSGTTTNWWSGAVNASVAFRLTGGGVSIFSGNNASFSSPITNIANTLVLKSANALGSGNYHITADVITRYEDVDQTYSQTFGFDSAATVHEVQTGRKVTLTGVASGSGGMVKTGDGTMELRGANTFTGNITVSAGSLVLTNATAMGTGAKTLTAAGGTLLFNLGMTNTSADVQMSGGVIETRDAKVSLGALTLAADSTIDLRNGGSSGRLTFTDATRTAGTLTIYGWTGSEAGGTGDQIFFSNSAGVTAGFLSNVLFFGGVSGAQLLGTGELVPITPEPGTLLGGGMIFALLLGKLRPRKATRVGFL